MTRGPRKAEEELRQRLLGGLTLREHLRGLEKDLIVSVLEAVGQNRTLAAEVLGVGREGLWKKIRSHGIPTLWRKTVNGR